MPSALVVGGTGQVGRELVRLLAAQLSSSSSKAAAAAASPAPAFDRVVLLQRRAFPDPLPPGVETVVLDIQDRPDGLGFAEALRRVDASTLLKGSGDGQDHAFCALGTTRALAGSAAAFEALDFVAVEAFARLARAAGCTGLSLVSSASADAQSSFLYLRTKGRAEVAAAAEFSSFPTGFATFRPGMLRLSGSPQRRADWRPLEDAAEAVAGWLPQSWLVDMATTPRDVARAMLAVALQDRAVAASPAAAVGSGPSSTTSAPATPNPGSEGLRVFSNRQIIELSAGLGNVGGE
ncbi:hypothetical protein HK405_012011, partial [Cladochytrium tenue]